MLQLCISPKTAYARAAGSRAQQTGHDQGRLDCCKLLPHSVSKTGQHSQTSACRYRHTSYHRQTKSQWARDDPAYVIICCCLVALAGTSYCVTYAPTPAHCPSAGCTALAPGPHPLLDLTSAQLLLPKLAGTLRGALLRGAGLPLRRFSRGLWDTVSTVVSAVLVDFLLVGCGIATAGW